MAHRPVKEIVNQALQEIGLPQADTVISAPDDATAFQILGLINALGDQLCRAHDWQFLEETAQFTGDGIITEFPMPDNFGRMVNQTQWASKNKRPMFGPMTPQGWSWIQFGIVSVGVYYRYRIILDKFNVFPVPTDGEQFHFYYISKNWVFDPVESAVQGHPVYKDKITADTDVPLFDDMLMVAGAKFKIWSAKGMESTNLGREFQYMLDAEKAQSQGAPVIALDRRWEYLYVSGQNVPDGSWNV